jgi:uncharacterized protein (DUF1697 family)
MQTYISLLRGINVGSRTIKMVDLKECYEQAGFSNVSTFLQSGNVVFTSRLPNPEAVQSQLEAAVSSKFNYPAKIMVLEHRALQPIIDHYPFDSTDVHYQHYVIFLRPGLTGALTTDGAELDPKLEEVAVGDNVVYWKVEKGMTLRSHFAKVLTRPDFKEFHTVRNLNTLRKLSG